MFDDIEIQMRQAGFNITKDQIKIDDDIHRFDAFGKNDGWMIFFQNLTKKGSPYIVGQFGSWKSGEAFDYKSAITATKADRKKIESDVFAIQKKVEIEKAARQKVTAEEAEILWKNGTENVNSDYLKLKQIDCLYGCKTVMRTSGRELVIPMKDINGKLWGTQKILPDGSKFFMQGQKKSGCFHIIQDSTSLDDTEVICVAEGFATAVAIHQALSTPVVVAFDSGNLDSVVSVIRNKYPSKKICICGDDDKFTKKPDGEPTNPGREKATEAAKNNFAYTVFPAFKNTEDRLTDFDDLKRAEGLDEVRKQLNAAINLIIKTAKPCVVLNAGQESETINIVYSLLIEESKKNKMLFLRGGKIVYLNRKDSGKLHLELLTKEKLLTLLALKFDWVTYNHKEELVHCNLPERLVAHILHSPPQEMLIVESLKHLPYFNAEGALIYENGYNEKTRIILDAPPLLNDDFFHNTITNEYAKECFKTIFEICHDFPFATRADKLHYLSILFHPLLKSYYLGSTPLFFITATRPNTGKSLLADIAWYIIRGTKPDSFNFPKTEEEQVKQITASFIDMLDVFYYDNLPTDKLDSTVLARLATQPNWSARLLSKNEIFTCANNACFIFTANALNATGELIRRSPRICLASPIDERTKRDRSVFKFPELMKYIIANRNKILTSMYVVVRYWLENGAKKAEHNRYLPSFEEWSDTMAGIFSSVSEDHFLLGQEDYTNQTNNEIEIIDELLEVWWDKFKDSPIKASDLVTNLCTAELLTEILSSKNPNALSGETGKFLFSFKNKVQNNFKLVLAKDKGRKGRWYQLVKLEVGGGTPNNPEEQVELKLKS